MRCHMTHNAMISNQTNPDLKVSMNFRGSWSVRAASKRFIGTMAPTVEAKCTVLVIQHHCGQTFSIQLGGREVRRFAGGGTGRSPAIFFDDFGQFLETNSLSLKAEFLEIGNVRLREIGPCMSR